MYSDRDWDRHGDEGNDWDTGTSRERGGGYRDRDRPRSRSHPHSRSRSHSRTRDHHYRDRDKYWDRSDRDRDRDRDRDSRDNRDTRDNRDRDRERDRSPFYGAPPCRDVILEGFGIETSEEDIMNELVEVMGVEGVEAMNIIKDRTTGQSRGFGFARFTTVAFAKKFLAEHYPSVRMFPEQIKIKCAFSRTGGGGGDGDKDRGRRGRDGEDEWTCRVCMMLNFSRRTECYRCATPKSVALASTLTHPTPTFFQNDGSRDVEETTASQFLLFRELAEGVGEEMLAKDRESGNSGEAKVRSGGAAAAAAVPGGAREGSVKRVLLVRDRRTGESWRFGFVEFAGVEDSKAAYDKYLKLDRFTIASKPVSVSFIHSGVFVPVYNIPTSTLRNIEKYTFLGSNGLRLAYWDEEGYVSEHVVTAPSSISNATNPTVGQGVDKPPENAATAGTKSKKRKAAADTDKGVGSGGGGGGGAAAGAASVAAVGGSSSKKTLPSHLQFWQDRHLELHGVVPADNAGGGDSGAASESDGGAGAGAKKKKLGSGPAAPVLGAVPGIPMTASTISAAAVGTESGSAESRGDAAGDGPPAASFADLSRLACLLCARQFKSAQEVHKHERISTLHRTNLSDPKLVETARAKLAKAGIVNQPAAATVQPAQPVYRDRAKERRAVFGQPKRPDLSSTSSSYNPSSNTTSTGTAAPTRSRSATPPPAPAPPSKGAALLSKMGWTGAGLGAGGKGITAPVVAEMYAEGVGLGAKGGKVGEASEVAGANTVGGYKDFVRRTKEKAKERFEGMS
ncbi:hypothetical protein BDZ91DRAFT_771230 [Kalaharituber pfeilii]|nr:hypothetical protein BDZ91DRAFT_771230 [Kalaharituber pfeilii]